MNSIVNIPFNNSFVRVGEKLFEPQLPTPVKKPGLIRVNYPLAEALSINPEELISQQGVEILAGNRVPEGANPIATVYAGHQFGHWNPQLGDGRAILLGEVLDKNNNRYDIQLKGAGPTPYSRTGDGRSPLGPVLREYIVSEAMAAMGVPSSRSLAAVTTGEQVFREGMLPGAILTRVASSHIRIGTFQYFAARQDWQSVTQLADHVIERHYPDIKLAENPYLELLDQVIQRQAQLIALWQSIGFIHGVMNTDNMLVSGETIDYGPCAFMDSYHPKTVFSSIDRDGRYAYQNQPQIAQWNLVWLAQSLLPLLADNETDGIALAQQTLDKFSNLYQTAYHKIMANKLGFTEANEQSSALLDELLKLMAKHKIDFTLGFRALADLAHPEQDNPQSVVALFQLPTVFDGWIQRWHALRNTQGNAKASQSLMYASNPVFIPRNHLVEDVIQAATWSDNFQPFHDLVDLLEKPYQYRDTHQRYALPPTPDQVVTQTFCGT